MIWRSDALKKPSWLGPQRGVLQDGNHTVWMTVSGKLFRSAPEHVRLALPEEGEPASPWLPDEITAGQRQINQRTKLSAETTEEMPNHPQVESQLNSPQGDHPNSPDDQSRNPEPADPMITEPFPVTPPSNPASTSQPNHEPSNQDGVSSHEGENIELGNSEEHEIINLVCQDVEDALAMQSDSVHSAWRCKFDVQLPTTLSQ